MRPGAPAFSCYRREVHRGYLFVFLAAALWGSTAAVSKLMLLQLDNVQVLAVTTLFGTITLAIVTVVQGKGKTLFSWSPRDYLVFAGMGFLGIFAYQFLLQGAITLIPTQEAFVINYAWPIMVVLFAATLLGERLTQRDIGATLVSFIGVGLVISRGNLGAFTLNPAGVAMALGAAAVGGLFFALGKRKDRDPISSMVLYSGFAFIYSVVALILFSRLPQLSLAQVGGLAWLGMGPYGLAYVFWFMALQKGSTAGMSSAIFITPFLSAVYVFVLLHEQIVWSSIVGLTIIVAGILFQAYGERHHRPLEAKTA
jgi:drug/metabolite transporter (DMT)-like permease